MRRVNDKCNQGRHRSATPMSINPQATVVVSHLHQNWPPNPVLAMNSPTDSPFGHMDTALGDTLGAPPHNIDWVEAN